MNTTTSALLHEITDQYVPNIHGITDDTHFNGSVTLLIDHLLTIWDNITHQASNTLDTHFTQIETNTANSNSFCKQNSSNDS